MTLRRYRLALRILLVAVSLQTPLFGQILEAATRFALSAEVSKTPTRDGDPIYRVAVNASTFLSDGPAEILSLVAPDATTARVLGSEWHSLFVDDLSIEEARSIFSGKWSFTELRNGQLLHYEFALPEITPSLFPSTPVILSPGEGDVVGADLLLEWAYPDGRTDSGLSFRGSGSNGVTTDLRGMVFEDTSARVPLRFDEGMPEGTVTIAVGQSQTRFFDVAPVTPGADASFVFKTVSIKSFSIPLTVTARIPEPTAAILLITTLGFALSGDVRRRE